jgi:hypothetical protein
MSMKSLGHSSVRLSLLLLVTSVFVAAWSAKPSPVSASPSVSVMPSCIAQPEDGNWVNTDSGTRSLTRIQLRFVCQDQVLNGELYPPGPPWYMHIFGKCHPTDCDWGEVGAQRLSSGHIFATYNQGFARRYVYAKMSMYRPGQLWVYTWNDFTDPARPDYEVQNWFRRL